MGQLSFDFDFPSQGWARATSRLQQNPYQEAFVKGLLQPANDLQTLFNLIINQRILLNAIGVQLDLIGSIVGQSRVVANGTVVYYFGYTGETGAAGYGQAPYRRQNQAQTTSIMLSDADYASLILLKIALNNGHGTAPEIISSCQAAFRTQNVVMTDTGGGAFTLTIGQPLAIGSPLYDVGLAFIMKAAGVAITIKFTS